MVYSTSLHVLSLIPQVGGCKYFLEVEIACRKETIFKFINFPGLYFLMEMHNKRKIGGEQ